jgi:hypothetical protein
VDASAEVDNFDVIVAILAVEENVFRFEIAVHNVFLVAVVHARHYLFHEDASIGLVETSLFTNDVEEFAALANLGYDVKPLFIGKELVHLNDVGVINLFQNSDLVFHLVNLVFLHGIFLHDFDRALDSRFPVHNNSDFSKSARSKHLANPVEVL